MRAAAAIASLALLAGCVRSVRVEPGGGKPVDTGVPVAFSVEGAGAGADVDVEWTFGDGARVEHGARVAHAFDRAGRYQVVARSLGRVVGGAAVDVQPRPVLRAVPAAAQAALYCPAPRGRLDDAADFLDGMLGPGGASDLLDRTGVVRLALQSAAAGEGAVDPDEGLAFFTLPGVSGAVAAVGVVDGDAALGVLGQSLEEQGAGLSQSAGGYVRVHRPGRVDAGAFLDRGYLYLALPERDAQVEEQLQRVVGLVAAAGAGAEAWPLIRELEGSVPRGLCALALPGRPGAVVRGLYASLQVAGKELHVEGVLRAGQPLWTAPAAAPSLLESGPDGPAAAVSISAPPEVLASLLLGAGGSPERRRSEEAL
ncbi:MAG TPA: PKD domain-containing protein, partial [Myxococcales bacterium]|nr:PKD domain-containing protein [Myxococcales bacterium]